jgi:hypothetical protein
LTKEDIPEAEVDEDVLFIESIDVVFDTRIREEDGDTIFLTSKELAFLETDKDFADKKNKSKRRKIGYRMLKYDVVTLREYIVEGEKRLSVFPERIPSRI